jgi:hypothetical protein
MSKQQQRQGITVTSLLSQCTGIMKLDDDDNYAGYYTRQELMQAMLSEGHDAKSVDYYVFSIKECQEQHPSDVSNEGNEKQ